MAQQYAADVDRLPDHMKSGARAYIEEGRMPGGFLYAVLCDDFTDAVGRADATNEAHLKAWGKWLFNDIPASAWGDEETVKAWMAKGGMSE
jgi:hypothetical protein